MRAIGGGFDWFDEVERFEILWVGPSVFRIEQEQHTVAEAVLTMIEAQLARPGSLYEQPIKWASSGMCGEL